MQQPRTIRKSLRLLVIFGLMMSVFGLMMRSTGLASAATPGTTYQNTYPGPNYVGPADDAGYTAVDQVQTPGVLHDDMFISTQFGFKDSTAGGYAGIQTHGALGDGTRTNMAIFSIWDAKAAIHGPGAICVPFDGEGVGMSCRAPLAVVSGHAYDVHINADHVDGAYQWWHATITDQTTNHTVDLGLIEANTTNPATVTDGFMEYFGSDSGLYACDQNPYSTADFSNPMLTPADGSPAAAAELRTPPAPASCAMGTMTVTPTGVHVEFGGPKPNYVSNVTGRIHNGAGLISWENPTSDGGSPILNTIIETSTNGGATFPATTTVAAGITSTMLTGLDPNTNVVRIAAVNAAGIGAYSTAGVLPSAPNLVKVVPGPAKAMVTFIPPADSTAGSVTGYVITPYVNGVAETPRVFNSTATTEVIGNVTNKKAYTFSVAAVNTIGTSAASNRSTPITIGAPKAPTNVRVAKTGARAAKVSFSAGANNGSPIKKYTVVATPMGGGVTKTKVSTKSPAKFTGLAPGKHYTITVTATNARGTSPTSVAAVT